MLRRAAQGVALTLGLLAHATAFAAPEDMQFRRLLDGLPSLVGDAIQGGASLTAKDEARGFGAGVGVVRPIRDLRPTPPVRPPTPLAAAPLDGWARIAGTWRHNEHLALGADAILMGPYTQAAAGYARVSGSPAPGFSLYAKAGLALTHSDLRGLVPGFIDTATTATRYGAVGVSFRVGPQMSVGLEVSRLGRVADTDGGRPVSLVSGGLEVRF